MIDSLPDLLFLSLFITFLLFSGVSCQQPHTTDDVVTETDRRLLVFSKTSGWRHSSIEDGKMALQKLGRENDVDVTLTENAEYFQSDSLKNYSAVIFLNTTETIFNEDQRNAFENYIRSGGGFVGIHSAADTEYDWPFYGELVGAYFDNHPPGTPNANVLLQDPSHPSTAMLPDVWNRDDEWYNYRGFEKHINVLLTLDTESYEGSDHPGNHPIAWYHDHLGGRSFYTGLGHTGASYTEELFLKHIWGGIEYAMGEQFRD